MCAVASPHTLLLFLDCGMADSSKRVRQELAQAFAADARQQTLDVFSRARAADPATAEPAHAVPSSPHPDDGSEAEAGRFWEGLSAAAPAASGEGVAAVEEMIFLAPDTDAREAVSAPALVAEAEHPLTGPHLAGLPSMEPRLAEPARMPCQLETLEGFVGNHKCRRCMVEIEDITSKGVRVCCKSPPKFQCPQCCSKQTALTRLYGRWPVPEFAGLTPSEKEEFYRSTTTHVDSLTIASVNIIVKIRLEQHIGGTAGTFLPLSVYEKMGFDPAKIEESTPAADVEEHTVLGKTYRVMLKSSSHQHIEQTLRQETLAAMPKKKQISASPVPTQVPSIDPSAGSSVGLPTPGFMLGGPFKIGPLAAPVVAGGQEAADAAAGPKVASSSGSGSDSSSREDRRRRRKARRAARKEKGKASKKDKRKKKHESTDSASDTDNSHKRHKKDKKSSKEAKDVAAEQAKEAKELIRQNALDAKEKMAEVKKHQMVLKKARGAALHCATKCVAKLSVSKAEIDSLLADPKASMVPSGVAMNVKASAKKLENMYKEATHAISDCAVNSLSFSVDDMKRVVDAAASYAKDLREMLVVLRRM